MNSAAALPLRDIHLPEAVAWWPPAPAWWAVAVLLLVFLVVVILVIRRSRLRRKHQKNLLDQQAFIREQLSTMYDEFESMQDARATCTTLSLLLRRVCLKLFPREEFASLHAQPWLDYLNEKEALTHDFMQGYGRLLITLPYQNEAEANAVEVRRLLQHSEDWMLAVLIKYA